MAAPNNGLQIASGIGVPFLHLDVCNCQKMHGVDVSRILLYRPAQNLYGLLKPARTEVLQAFCNDPLVDVLGEECFESFVRFLPASSRRQDLPQLLVCCWSRRVELDRFFEGRYRLFDTTLTRIYAAQVFM